MIRPFAVALASIAAGSAAADPNPSDWQSVLDEARGQVVHWHAWGGDPRINDFISWLGAELESRHGVELVHVKLSDTADAVGRVIAERGAGRDEGGAVDAIWINGPNFAAMKAQNLLFGPFADWLPNWRLVDTVANPGVLYDFTLPVAGYGAPWASFRMVFEYDSAVVPVPPRNIVELGDWAASNPGRFTYPQPPDFSGMSFLKQALAGLAEEPEALARPVDEDSFQRLSEPLWDFLDQLEPHLWRAGRAYPPNEAALGQLLADGEIAIGFSYNPGRVSAALAAGELPATARTFVFDGGTLGNSSFLAIPYNASSKAGAMVLANLILAPEVQARAQDPGVLGFQTVLGMQLLDEGDRARFDAIVAGPATLAPEELGAAIPEPHQSWERRLAEEWLARYGLAR